MWRSCRYKYIFFCNRLREFHEKQNKTKNNNKKKQNKHPQPPPPPPFKKQNKTKKKQKKQQQKTTTTKTTITHTHTKQQQQQQWPGPEVITLFSCSTQLRMKFVLLINLKLLKIANSFFLNIVEYENFSANKYENANYCWHFHIY